MELEVWSDIACPWCYVGKRRLEAALAGFEHADAVDVRWRSFELDPDAPSDGEHDLTSELAAKYGISREEALARRAQMVATAAADGIAMRPDLTRVVNTFDAHRLMTLGRARGLQDAVGERFLRAQHCEGEALGDHATLERLAVEAGLDAAEVRAVLAGDAYADEVRDDERTAAAVGIRGVPFFVADRAFAASGAQPPEVLREVLRRAWAAQGATPVRAAS